MVVALRSPTSTWVLSHRSSPMSETLLRPGLQAGATRLGLLGLCGPLLGIPEEMGKSRQRKQIPETVAVLQKAPRSLECTQERNSTSSGPSSPVIVTATKWEVPTEASLPQKLRNCAS